MSGNGLLIILSILIIVCVLMSCRTSHFTANLPDPSATTKMELISEKIYEVIKKNQEEQGDYLSFIDALKKEGIEHPGIDMKFYMTIDQAYRNRLLTRAYLMNKLEYM